MASISQPPPPILPQISILHDQREKIQRRRKREILFYKLACLVYSLVVILLLLCLIARAFRYKFNKKLNTLDKIENEDDNSKGKIQTDLIDNCHHMSNWIDSTISILTLIIIIIASIILVASFRFVFAKPILVPILNSTEDFIRRNSHQPNEHLNTSSILQSNTNPKIISPVTSQNWLLQVRHDAYLNRQKKAVNFSDDQRLKPPSNHLLNI